MDTTERYSFSRNEETRNDPIKGKLRFLLSFAANYILYAEVKALVSVHILRDTVGSIQFEDLDSHRFVELVRELLYDYKDWQSIEATSKEGTDEGLKQMYRKNE